VDVQEYSSVDPAVSCFRGVAVNGKHGSLVYMHSDVIVCGEKRGSARVAFAMNVSSCTNVRWWMHEVLFILDFLFTLKA